jgi:hypothetical protein
VSNLVDGGIGIFSGVPCSYTRSNGRKHHNKQYHERQGQFVGCHI